DAAAGVFRQEIGDGGIVAQGVQQFDLGIGQLDEDRDDAMGRLIHRVGNLGPQGFPVKLRCRRQVRNGDGHMVQASNHVLMSLIYTLMTCTWVMGPVSRPVMVLAARRAATRMASASRSSSSTSRSLSFR